MCAKIRGITSNYQTLQRVNFDTIKDMVIGIGPDRVSLDTPYKTTRDTNPKIVTKQQSKDYRIVYKKRAVVQSEL